MKRLSFVLSVLLTLLLTVPTCSYGYGYVGHVLSTWGISSAEDINDSGQIVGSIQSQDTGISSAVLWSCYESNPQSLDEGNSFATAQLINNAGLVVGEHNASPGVEMPFQWSLSTGVINAVDFTPEALNENGTMVGWGSTSNGQQVPVAVSSTGGVTYLDYTCGNGGVACDINGSGYIAGDSSAPVGGGHACVWNPGGDVTDIGTFGGTWSDAMGINNSGQVVGLYGNGNGGIGSYIWSSNSATIFIPTSSQLDDGVFAPVDINDNGVVLGNAEIKGVQTVVTWSSAGGFTIVGTGIAHAINNSGWIVGENDLNNSQAIVWQPVPEPSAFVALACGLVGILTQRRKRRIS